MSIYDGISFVYEKWSSGDAVYDDTLKFYTSALIQMTGGKYIELGVGTGRISIAAVRLAPITIVGLDISEKMLNECEKNYKKITQPKGNLILRRSSFTDLDYAEEFNGAVLPFRTIGHIMSDAELDAVFRGVYRALKPGGWFLFDHYMFCRDWAEAHNEVDIPMYKDSETAICDRYCYNFEENKMWCDVKVNEKICEGFEFRWMSPELIKGAAEKSGFEIASLMGDFDGSVWSEGSTEQIWLLRKPTDGANIRIPVFDL